MSTFGPHFRIHARSYYFKMRVPGKKLIEYKSRKYFVYDKKSKTISMPMNQNGFKVVNNKRCYLTPGYRKKRACKRKNNLNGKPIETVQKKSNFNTDKRICSSKVTGKRTYFSVRKNSKNFAGSSIKNSVRRRRLKRSKKNIVQDEVYRLQRRARYILIKMKLEQNLIDAYSGDGWKGQSREKIKPEKELQRAQRQILECKLGIRDLIHQLDLLGSEGRIEDSVMHPDGSVFHEHIFCAKCKSREAFHDNDIILCDGNCNCGFHQKCLEPQLEKIPPGDQGWLCKVCNCKMEILEIINAHLGTCFTVSSCWEDIFKEAIVGPDALEVCPNLVEDWPSDDSEDEDYCPEINKAEFDQSFSDDACNSIDSVVSSDASLNFTSCLGSSDSGDDVTNYRRQRRDVDYKKLYYEMFGIDSNEGAEQSEDEDWGPYRKKKVRISSDSKNKDDHEKMALEDTISCNKRSFLRIPPDAIEAEASKQSDHRSDVSIVNGGNAHISEAAVSLDSSFLLPLSSIFHLPRHKKRIHGRENLISAAFSVKKQKGVATKVRSRGIQMQSRLKNTVWLKKHTITRDGDVFSKITTAFAAEEKQLHLNKMEMIWTLDRRLHQLKQRLLACKNDNEVQMKNTSGELAVIYVPVAEVKEKASWLEIISS